MYHTIHTDSYKIGSDFDTSIHYRKFLWFIGLNPQLNSRSVNGNRRKTLLLHDGMPRETNQSRLLFITTTIVIAGRRRRRSRRWQAPSPPHCCIWNLRWFSPPFGLLRRCSGNSTPGPEYNLLAYFFRKLPKNLNYKCVIGFLVNYLILRFFFFTTPFLGLMQLQNSGGGEASASQFILTYIPRSQDRCFSNYMYGDGIAAALFYHFIRQRIEFMGSLVAVLPLHPVTLYYYELH